MRNEACIPVRDWPEAKEEIAEWFHERWHIPLEAYKESIWDCLRKETGIPQWYVVVRGSRIIAGCGVIENDFHERKDLTPNVCAVYVDEEFRNQGIAGFLLQYVCDDMSTMGIDTLYLLTDHTGFYERYGWEFLFLGANMDAISAARTFGIREDRAVRYTFDSAGTSLNFEVASRTIARVRSGQEIDANWCAEIEEDYGKRG